MQVTQQPVQRSGQPRDESDGAASRRAGGEDSRQLVTAPHDQVSQAADGIETEDGVARLLAPDRR